LADLVQPDLLKLDRKYIYCILGLFYSHCKLIAVVTIYLWKNQLSASVMVQKILPGVDLAGQALMATPAGDDDYT